MAKIKQTKKYHLINRIITNENRIRTACPLSMLIDIQLIIFNGTGNAGACILACSQYPHIFPLLSLTIKLKKEKKKIDYTTPMNKSS